MNDIPDDQFDARVRDRLRAVPTPRSISNLSERAIALAISQQPVTQSPLVHHWRPKHARIMTFSTTFATLTIAGILLVGTWLLVTRDISFSASSISASSSEQADGLGFAIVILAGLAVIVGVAIRSILDSIDPPFRFEGM